MSRHFDPMCPYSEATQVVSDVPGPLAYCQCDLIARVRADEQKQYDLAMFSQYRRDRDAEMADLRAKVEALRTENSGAAKSGNRLDQDFNLGKVYAYERVLDLIRRECG